MPPINNQSNPLPSPQNSQYNFQYRCVSCNSDPCLCPSFPGSFYNGTMIPTYGRMGRPDPTPRKPLEQETCVMAIAGWRRWKVPAFRDVLISNNSTEWKPYEKLSASHYSRLTPTDGSQPIVVEDPNCEGTKCICGIYAYKTREQAEDGKNAPTDDMHVYGEVWLWGRVIEHEIGYRAQYAYPKSIVNTGGVAAKIAGLYRCELIAPDYEGIKARQAKAKDISDAQHQVYMQAIHQAWAQGQNWQGMQNANPPNAFYGQGLQNALPTPSTPQHPLECVCGDCVPCPNSLAKTSNWKKLLSRLFPK